MNQRVYNSVLVLLACLLSLCFADCRAQQLRAIAVHPDATTNERLAAKEVQRYAYLTSGKLCPVVEKTVRENRSGNIYIGTAFLPEGMPEGACPETFVVKNVSDNLYLAGQSDVATLYSAYRFAELLGVRFQITGDIIPDRDKTPVTIPAVDEVHTPLFETRGLLPFHDFPEGPDWWTIEDYKVYLAQMVKMKMNFIGMHTYPEGGSTAEPTVWIGLKEDVLENGAVSYSYPASYANTGLVNPWGYSPMQTSDFAAGASRLFAGDWYGPQTLEGLEPRPVTMEQCNELFARQSRFFHEALRVGRSQGIRVCVGLETPLVLPQKVKDRLAEKGMDINAHETKKRLYEGIFHRMSLAFPVDAFWLWLPEYWTLWGATDEQVKAAFEDVGIARQALQDGGYDLGFGLCGWVLGPQDDRSAFDKILPPDVAMSCINRSVGFEWIDPAFNAIKTRRPKWAIPWLEDDHAMISTQLWVGRTRRDAADALSSGCTGLIGLMWRTGTIAHNISALAGAGWDQRGWNPDLGKSGALDIPDSVRTARARDLQSGDFYLDWSAALFGANVAEPIAAVFSRLDGGGYIPGNHDLANVPRPSDWKGPGAINVTRTPWSEEKIKYAFIEELESIAPRIEGEGNRARFGYWLSQFRYIRTMGELACKRGEYTALIEQIREMAAPPDPAAPGITEEGAPTPVKADFKMADATGVILKTRNEAFPLRIELSRLWEQMMTHLLEHVSSSGELGTIANVEQHNRMHRKYLTEYDEQLAVWAQTALPSAVKITDRYVGTPRLIVTAARTLAEENETIVLHAILLDNQGAAPTVHYRSMGRGAFRTLEMEHRGRGVYSIALPAARGSLEYYIEARSSDGRKLIWPATAPRTCHTVVVNG